MKSVKSLWVAALVVLWILTLAILFAKVARVKKLSDTLADVGYDISYSLDALEENDILKCLPALQDSMKAIRAQGLDAKSFEEGRLDRFIENERLRGLSNALPPPP